MYKSNSCNVVHPAHEDEPGAFAATFKHYYNPLVYFAQKLLPDALAAEDIVTEIFLKYWQKQKDFSSALAVKTFLFISTRNACVNYKRLTHRRARSKETLCSLTDDFEDFVLNQITRTEVLHEIYALLEVLPLQCRKIVLMSYIGGLSNRQIARRLELSIHTVKNQKVRGIQLMRVKARRCVA
jgi:RNA polymerase sigma-70 factor (ECF subfamily)